MTHLREGFTHSEAALVEAVAHRVVELLDERDRLARSTRLVDAQTLADMLGVSRATIYKYAIELGARKVGLPPRGVITLPPGREWAAARHRCPNGCGGGDA